MPDTMHAIVLTRYGTPDDLELREVDRPVPGPGQVLVEIHAAAVNDWEWGLVRGKPVYIRAVAGLREPKWSIPGTDIAGTVAGVGTGVRGPAVGDDVYGDLSDSGFGGFAEYVAVREAALERMPHNLSHVEAAAVPHAAGLAYQSLYDVGRVDRVRNLLVNGAGGGVGPIALQLAKRHGVEVTGVDHTDKLEYLRALGFDHVIDYTTTDFTKAGERYELILDVKTTRSPRALLRAIESGGAYVTAGGSTPRLLQCATVGRFAGRRSGRRISVLALKPNKGLAAVTELIEAGEITPPVDRVYPLAETPAAIRRFGAAKQHGRVIIQVS